MNAEGSFQKKSEEAEDLGTGAVLWKLGGIYMKNNCNKVDRSCLASFHRTMDEDNEVVVQVAMEMTLDEWKAMQEVNRPKAEFNIRKAEDKIPSKAKVIHQSKYLENTRETVEELEEEGNFFRRSMNDITTLLDINFGTLGRPRRGGRGRGARGGQSIRPERARPIYERVCYQLVYHKCRLC
ncbi:hypothetical protein GOODEAATRI_010530 [Goodea atripinnis]|uniref:Hyaluronan/mRNA-binding protein domain-containing protein n=1 Tax=Goodea atripinnis TaxID=208336 RepID=A0ABV0NJ48_9TELE